ncbi:hypothetical protein [Gelidibacter sp. F63206]|uniref:hypothetical protein n=1 Tax=Gelidibacter sp. F63206 TaxID=2926425 RepID=UPI001FF32063|nr:hypothetical protein [Gelidibacter sp. F63206]MCK0114971.1 hypothetical protein [Gelidibacter sp. F63206]
MTKEEGINQVFGGGGHVVILGAGASIASTYRNGEKSGKRLPSMDNFSELLSLENIIKQIPEELRENNFEKLYGNLHRENPNSGIIKEIEEKIQSYFGNMELPSNHQTQKHLCFSDQLKLNFYWVLPLN